MMRFLKNKKVAAQDMFRKLTARYARGNVNLQRGCYVTEEEIQERKRQVLKHKFV